MSLQNSFPHDSFAKKVFTDLVLASEFLSRYLPAPLASQLDFSTLKIIGGNFIDDEHRSHQSDILYEVQTHNSIPLILYILIEHKSRPEKWAIVQLLRYMLAKWEQDIDNGADRLTPIIPILFYHGQVVWPYPTNLGDYFYRDSAWEAYIPGFEMILRDYSEKAETTIEGSRYLQAILRAFQAVQAKNFEAAFEALVRYLMESSINDHSRGLKLVGQIVYYYTEGAERLTLKQLEAVFKQFGREGEKIVQTIATQLRDEGRVEGERIGIEKMIIRMLKRGNLTHAEIAEEVGLPLSEIERIDQVRLSK